MNLPFQPRNVDESRLRSSLALFAAVAVLLAAVAATAAPKPPKNIDTSVGAQTFRYKFKVGEERVYRTSMEQKVSMDGDVNMPAMDAVSRIDADMAIKTRNVKPDGSALLEMTYKDFDLKLLQNGVELPKKQLEPLAQMVTKLRSETIMSSRGEPKSVSVKGGEAIAQLADSMKNALIGSAPVFPKKALKPGERWKQSVPMDLSQGPMKIKIDFTTHYTFLGVTSLGGKKVAVFKTEVEAVVNGPDGGSGLSVSGSGKGGGYIYFDHNAGHLVRSELELKQNTTMEMRGKGAANTNAIKMKQQTSSSMSLKGSAKK